jgi:alpha-tubulin suppressor-like RCC1 family protein
LPFRTGDLLLRFNSVIAIAAGSFFGLALRSNGSVVAWGTAPSVPAGLSNVIAIAAGQGARARLESKRYGRRVG